MTDLSVVFLAAAARPKQPEPAAPTPERAALLRQLWFAGTHPTRMADRLEVSREQVEAWARALGLPRREHATGRLHEAYGEFKTLREWATDTRCQVPFNTLRARVNSFEWPLKRALRVVTERADGRRVNELYEAFGERRTLADWARDARCRVSYVSLRERVSRGMGLTEALTRPPRLRRDPAGMTAFGEAKSMREWADDPRCVVPYTALRQRVYNLGWDLTEALTTPNGQKRGEPLYEAFGQRLRCGQWAADPRCVVSAKELRRRVLELRWDVEAALTTPLGQGDPARRDRIHLSDDQIAAALERLRGGASLTQTATALSVMPKTLRRHSRHHPELATAVDRAEARYRLTPQREHMLRVAWQRGTPVGDIARAMDVSDATVRRWADNLDLPKRGMTTRRKYTLFGETKSFLDWIDDPRCVVPRGTASKRFYQLGWELEAALTTPATRRSR